MKSTKIQGFEETWDRFDCYIYLEGKDDRIGLTLGSVGEGLRSGVSARVLCGWGGETKCRAVFYSGGRARAPDRMAGGISCGAPGDHSRLMQGFGGSARRLRDQRGRWWLLDFEF